MTSGYCAFRYSECRGNALSLNLSTHSRSRSIYGSEARSGSRIERICMSLPIADGVYISGLAKFEKAYKRAVWLKTYYTLFFSSLFTR